MARKGGRTRRARRLRKGGNTKLASVTSSDSLTSLGSDSSGSSSTETVSIAREYTLDEARRLLDRCQSVEFSSPHVDAPPRRTTGHARDHALNLTDKPTTGVSIEKAMKIQAQRGDDVTLSLFCSTVHQDRWLQQALNHALGQKALQMLEAGEAIRITVGLNVEPFEVHKVVPSVLKGKSARIGVAYKATQVRAVLQLDEDHNLAIVTVYPFFAESEPEEDAWLSVETALGGWRYYSRSEGIVKEVGGVKHPYGSPHPVAALREKQHAARELYEREVTAAEIQLRREAAELGMPIPRYETPEVRESARRSVRKSGGTLGAKQTPVRMQDRKFYLTYAQDPDTLELQSGPYFYKKRDGTLGLVDPEGCGDYGLPIHKEKWLCVTTPGQAASMAAVCDTPKRRKTLEVIAENRLLTETAIAVKGSPARRVADELLGELQRLDFETPGTPTKGDSDSRDYLDEENTSLASPIIPKARRATDRAEFARLLGTSGGPLSGRSDVFSSRRSLDAEFDAAELDAEALFVP